MGQMFRRIVVAITIIAIGIGAAIWILNSQGYIPGPWVTIISVIFTTAGLIFTFLAWISSIPQTGTGRQAGARQPVPIRYILSILLALLLIALGTYGAIIIFPHIQCTTSDGTTVTEPPLPANGIGVIRASDGTCLGISNGQFAFDTQRRGGSLKQQGAARSRAGDNSEAQRLWNEAKLQDTNDAETLIYLENQRVIASGRPYITIVVATVLSGADTTTGRDNLQGAYVAQKEYNDGSKLRNGFQALQIRLLVANFGTNTVGANTVDNAVDAVTVAKQIIQASQNDGTIVGVMGWPFSSIPQEAINSLAAAHISMVSPSASSDSLSKASPYFFRVVPPNESQGIAAADYAIQQLHAKNVALFYDHDPTSLYSNSLAKDFRKRFEKDGGYIVADEPYTVGHSGALPGLLQDALKANPAPDLIYFSGYVSDIGTLLTNLPTSGPFATLQVLGGDALYSLGDYPSSAVSIGFSRLRFTAFAYADEWDVLNLKRQKPFFFNEYPDDYDPARQHQGSPYGYTRPDNDVIVSYDATLALLHGCQIALDEGGSSLTPSDLRNGLLNLTGSQALQGVSGQISFGPDGDPINKAIVILFVDADRHIEMEAVRNCFLVGSCSSQ